MSNCLCGALDCSSCGPAQGATKCEKHNMLACMTCESGEVRRSDFLEDLEYLTTLFAQLGRSGKDILKYYEMRKFERIQEEIEVLLEEIRENEK